MSFDRGVLAVAAAVVFLAGVACVASPASFGQQAGLAATPSGLTEIRAFYGGLQIGLGCFLIWCVRRQTLIRAGLLLVGFTVGAIGAFRVLGMLVDRAPTTYHAANLVVEVVTVAVVAVALARNQRLAHGGGGEPRAR
jgi:hypothetical protein